MIDTSVREAGEGSVSGSARRLGLVLGGAIAPEHLRPVAMRAEELGFDELWLSEDCFFTGGISGATTALCATSGIAVGLGVVSAMLRQPALLAMEIATMARAFPDRLTLGVGLGAPSWLQQLERMPRSPRTAMTECVTALRRLLAGETLEAEGEYFTFHGVSLSHPPPGEVALHLGVVGQRLLQLSGAIADGSILSVGAGPRYIAWARRQIDVGRAAAARQDNHPVTAFALYALARDRQRAREQIRSTLAFYLADNDLARVQDLSATLAEVVGRGGRKALAAEMPAAWLEELAVSGTPEDCARQIREMHDAGADSVALLPVSGENILGITSMTASEVMPLLA